MIATLHYLVLFFFFNDTATTEIYTLSLHDALPISQLPILAKHSFRRSSSERTCASMASCNAAVPLLDNSAEAFLSRFCFQSRIACLVAVWASDAAFRYVFTQASAIEHVLHS